MKLKGLCTPDSSPRMNRGTTLRSAMSSEEDLDKVLVVSDDFVDIFIVNGNYVRGRWANEYTMGGNTKAYPHFCITPGSTKYEIWIDRDVHFEDKQGAANFFLTVFHELCEMYAIDNFGANYKQAHNFISICETVIRRMFFVGIFEILIHKDAFGKIAIGPQLDQLDQATTA